MIRVGISGMGAIGRRVLRHAVHRKGIVITAVNDLADTPLVAHLLRHDSTYGPFPGEVREEGDQLLVNGQPIAVLHEADPARIPWDAYGVDYVIEATGRFTDAAKASAHLRQGVRTVVISAPAKGDAPTVILGVNEDSYDPERHSVLSMGSCTTNCLLPVLRVLQEAFGVRESMMTTVHSYTNDQRVQDAPHKDLRRARAAAQNIIPTTTGAQKAVAAVWPDLGSRFSGLSLRVPTATVSLVDLVAHLERPATVQEVNEAFRSRAAGDLKGILGYSDEPLVSSDFTGSTESAVVDGPSTATVGPLVKVLAWYDNEWAYAGRLLDLIEYMNRRHSAVVAPSLG